MVTPPSPPPGWAVVLDDTCWRCTIGIVQTPAYTCVEAAIRAAWRLEAGLVLFPLAEHRPLERRPRWIAIGLIGQAVADG